MNIINVSVAELIEQQQPEYCLVPIGNQGEHGVTRILFDCTQFVSIYGEGIAQLLHQRNGDGIPYIANVSQDGNSITWDITGDDTARDGFGKLQLNWYVSGNLAKSCVLRTMVKKALTDATLIPEDVKSELELLTETVESKNPRLNAGTNVTITDNADGTQTISASGGGTSYTAGDGIDITGNTIKVKDEDLTFVFDFDYIQSQSQVVPRTGVTYAAITAALAKTANVYARLHIGTEYVDAKFCDVASNEVSALAVVYFPVSAQTSMFTNIRLKVARENNTDAYYILVQTMYSQVDIDTLLATKQNTLGTGNGLTLGMDGTLSLDIDNSLTFDSEENLKVNPSTVQYKLIAGTGISIAADGKTISATGGTSYSAGDGISISNDTIAVDYASGTGQSTTNPMTQKDVTDALATKQGTLTAGSGISIDTTTNTISATGGGGSVDVVQTTGQSTTSVMSQKAVTDELGNKQNALTAGTGIAISNGVIVATGSGVSSDSVSVVLGQDEICQYYGIKNDGTIGSVGPIKYGCTSYIDCAGVAEITLKRPQDKNSASGFGTAFYDANYDFISFSPNPVGSTIMPVTETLTVPSGAAYFRSTYYYYARSHDFTNGEWTCSMTYTNGLLKNGKRPYQSQPIFFAPAVNQGITDWTDTANHSIVNVSYKETTSVLWLPSTYTADGEPTKVIMIVHGQAQAVWYGVIGATNNYLKNKVKQYVDAGFAVLLCNGMRNNNMAANFPALGLPQGNEAYRKSYDYAMKHYNLDNQIFLMGLSMGGITALSYARQYSNSIRGLLLMSIWGSLYELVWNNSYGGGSAWQAIIDEYMGTQTYDLTNYNSGKFRGIAPELDKITIDNADYIRPFDFPVMAMGGGDESGQIINTFTAYMTALERTGSNVQHRLVSGLDHLALTRDATPVVDNDIINWCKTH